MIEGALDAMQEAKQSGKIRATGISDHQNGDFLAYVIERYHERLDMVMYPFSYVRREGAMKILPLIEKYDLGFVAMKPLARRAVLDDAGFTEYYRNIGNSSTETSPAKEAFRWVLAHPQVSVALAAVNALREIEENAGSSPGGEARPRATELT